MANPRAITSDANRNARILADARDDLQHTKQVRTDFFSEWRAGRATHHDYDVRARAPIIARTDHPRLGSWPGMRDPAGRPSTPAIQRWPRRVETPQGAGPNVFRSQKYRQAQNAAAATTADFAPAQFSYGRMLGRGGFGVALLFSMWDRYRTLRHVVVKADLRGRAAEMREERDKVIAMAGAEHMVQRVVLGAMPEAWAPGQATGASGLDIRMLFSLVIFLLRALWAGLEMLGRGLHWIWERRLSEAERSRAALNRPRSPVRVDDGLDPVDLGRLDTWWPASPSREARRQIDRRQDVLVLEFMKLGGLGKWIDKMSESRRTNRFSEKVLWLMFECLLRSCIAMAYPEQLNPGRVDARTRQVPVKTETASASDPTIRNPLVHFDLDPENGMVEYGPDFDVLPELEGAVPKVTDTFTFL